MNDPEGDQRIKVAVRVRPKVMALRHERYAQICTKKMDSSTLKLFHPTDQSYLSRKHEFTFNFVFDETDSQVDVFNEAVAEYIDYILDGSDVTIFAYGQTGSGKTFTVLGDVAVRETLGICVGSGIFLRLLTDLFRFRDQMAGKMEFALSIAIVEVYNEVIFDLLSSRRKVELREMGGHDDIPDLRWCRVDSLADAHQYYVLATRERSTTATASNPMSSRSHCLFIFEVTQTFRNPLPGQAASRSSRVYLVDLAGCERVSKSNVEGDALKEATFINKSLTTLGTVVNGLYEGAAHIPYRDSKLTRLLKSSFSSPRCRILVITNLSPTAASFNESVSSLRFADRVKALKTSAPSTGSDESAQEEAAYLVALERLDHAAAQWRCAAASFRLVPSRFLVGIDASQAARQTALRSWAAAVVDAERRAVDAERQRKLRHLLDAMEMTPEARRIALRVDELTGDLQRVTERMEVLEHAENTRSTERRKAAADFRTWKKDSREEQKVLMRDLKAERCRLREREAEVESELREALQIHGVTDLADSPEDFDAAWTTAQLPISNPLDDPIAFLHLGGDTTRPLEPAERAPPEIASPVSPTTELRARRRAARRDQAARASAAPPPSEVAAFDEAPAEPCSGERKRKHRDKSPHVADEPLAFATSPPSSPPPAPGICGAATMLQRQLAADLAELDEICLICEEDARQQLLTMEKQELLDAVDKVKSVPTNRVLTAQQAEALVSTMRLFDKMVTVQTSALGILAQVLEVAPANRELMTHMNVSLLILAAMKRFAWKPLLMTRAISAILHLSRHEGANAELSRLGAIPMIVFAMRSHPDDVPMLAAAASALWSMATRKENKVAIAVYLGVRQIVEMMDRFPGEVDLLTPACAALSSVAANPANLVLIAQLGGIKTLIETMRRYLHRDQLRLLSRAVTAICSLALGEQNKVIIAQAGGINYVLRCMDMFPHVPEILARGSSALCNLSAHVDNTRIIADLGGIDVILDGMRRFPGNPDVLGAGAIALSNLAIHPSNNQRIVALGGIQVVLRMLQEFPCLEELVTKALCALCAFALLDAHKQMLLRDGVVAHVVHAMNEFPASPQLLTKACAVVWNLSEDPQCRAEFQRVGAFALVQRALAQHGSSCSELRAEATGALTGERFATTHVPAQLEAAMMSITLSQQRVARDQAAAAAAHNLHPQLQALHGRPAPSHLSPGRSAAASMAGSVTAASVSGGFVARGNVSVTPPGIPAPSAQTASQPTSGSRFGSSVLGQLASTLRGGKKKDKDKASKSHAASQVAASQVMDTSSTRTRAPAGADQTVREMYAATMARLEPSNRNAQRSPGGGHAFSRISPATPASGTPGVPTAGATAPPSTQAPLPPPPPPEL
eukprot:TRINITY_DN21055_c0_g1_i1.p1 TRINITY_DN21055_c0_g1~~TRINITY_DN21055_c0_g1_i1.p1  ORF type:complete len:1427 (+),score=130.29 TRINITY_DN21055_c0_g1_i1:164-4282(+)